MGKEAARITLTPKQRAVLEPFGALAEGGSTPGGALSHRPAFGHRPCSPEVPAPPSGSDHRAGVRACRGERLPVSHWTPELAREAAKRGIVESISPRQVDRFLGGGPTAAQEPVLVDVAE